MGCGDSKGLTAKETPIKNKTSEQNLAKIEESKVGEKTQQRIIILFQPRIILKKKKVEKFMKIKNIEIK